ncbi:MAG: peptidoglycan DD-metalloendopeptidase family protein, partial [Candidatus Paceibacterales bacterium]
FNLLDNILNKPFRKKSKKGTLKGISQNPFFWFGVASFVLFGVLFFSSDSLAQPNYSNGISAVFFNSFFKNTDNLTNTDPFFNQNNKDLALETPDLNIQDNSIHAAATPSVMTSQSLGDIFGGQDNSSRTNAQDYIVQAGDTIASLADKFGITPETIAQANGISKNSALQVGDTITILPVSGVLHIVKNGDTVDKIASLYHAKTEDILAYNNNDPNLYIGQPVIVPGGIIVPQQKHNIPTITHNNFAVLPNSFFIFPLLKFIITQGLHYYNAVDMATSCGDSVYAAASGTVEKATFDRRYGNYVVIAHDNGASTYYGHLSSFFVKVGDVLTTGDRFATVGRTGTEATGCHVHFQVMGGFKNPLADYPVGTKFVDGNVVN